MYKSVADLNHFGLKLNLLLYERKKVGTNSNKKCIEKVFELINFPSLHFCSYNKCLKLMIYGIDVNSCLVVDINIKLLKCYLPRIV